MKFRHHRMLKFLLEDVEIGQVIDTSIAIDILVGKKGQRSNGPRRATRYANMSFIPDKSAMAYVLNNSKENFICEGTFRKRKQWRRIA